jgi:hypothetical protein
VNAFCKTLHEGETIAKRALEQTAEDRTPGGGRTHAPVHADGFLPANARSVPATKSPRDGIKISLGFSRFFYTPFLYCFDFLSQKWLKAANAKSEENPHKHEAKWE